MQILRFINTKPPWLRNGLLALLICLLLELFFILIYMPVIGFLFNGMIPTYALLPPTITGHILPVLAHFILPYGWLCKFDQPTCVHWSAEHVPGSVPWKEPMEGIQGYCVEQIMQPASACADRSELVGFILLTLALFIVYFSIGACYGLMLSHFKKPKT